MVRGAYLCKQRTTAKGQNRPLFRSILGLIATQCERENGAKGRHFLIRFLRPIVFGQ
jgi:hypothetical protein